MFKIWVVLGYVLYTVPAIHIAHKAGRKKIPILNLWYTQFLLLIQLIKLGEKRFRSIQNVPLAYIPHLIIATVTVFVTVAVAKYSM